MSILQYSYIVMGIEVSQLDTTKFVDISLIDEPAGKKQHFSLVGTPYIHRYILKLANKTHNLHAKECLDLDKILRL